MWLERAAAGGTAAVRRAVQDLLGTLRLELT
jgi:hypothetical protein